MKSAEVGYVIEVGDVVELKQFGRVVWTARVSRVTPKRAYVRFNELAEGFGPRVVDANWRIGAYDNFSRPDVYRVIKAADFAQGH